METQRYCNIAPLAIAHRTMRKTSLQDYVIPEVYKIIISNLFIEFKF